jgi:hypothetical protein
MSTSFTFLLTQNSRRNMTGKVEESIKLRYIFKLRDVIKEKRRQKLRRSVLASSGNSRLTVSVLS